jgi:hypothetical protein
LRFWTKAPLSGGASQRNEVLGDWRATDISMYVVISAIVVAITERYRSLAPRKEMEQETGGEEKP